MADLERWALVAGGSGGVGAQLCVAMAADGWNIALTWHRNKQRADEVAAEVRAQGRQSTVHQLDLTDEHATAKLVREAGDGLLSGIVYAAGPELRIDFASRTPPSRMREQLLGDTVACYNLLQPSIDRLRETRGAMLAVTTPGIRRVVKKHVLSAPPKAAIEAIIRAIAVEEGRYGVRANCLGIGLIEDGVWDSLTEQGHYNEITLAAARREIALGTLGRATDVASMGAFLMSDKASWISGQTIDVDGGYTV
jgi:NAD(P)-dependent dehydrogenase (short-subunit alcohol dehydrogenase family)